jgi:hypothetical protein
MNAPNTPFVAYPLRFELQAIDPIHLHAHNGSALRGMVYRAAGVGVHPVHRLVPRRPLADRGGGGL